MALNSINTNIAAIRAQSGILQASQSSSSSISRLSSGERIVRAADDVAALSAGTSLETNVVTLRTALINSFQGQSLLQVADGALAQITDILQRQKAIARYWNNLCTAPDSGPPANTNFEASYRLSDTALRCALYFRNAF